ncbi:MAG: hypothetical protein ABSB14_20790 [Candidatus Sulfotelmatobacter sp.]
MRHLAAICMLLAFAPAGIAADMTHEEAVVRNTYAKLSYAVDINTAYRVLLANAAILPANTKSDGRLAEQQDNLTRQLIHEIRFQRLGFQLSDFTCGNLADIAGAKYTDVFPAYDGVSEDVIHTAVETEKYSEAGRTTTMETVTAKWGPAGPGKTPDWTVAQMIPVAEQELGVAPLVSYCRFTVTASLQGRSRTYKAAFLFGPNGQAAPLDSVAGGDGNNLVYFFQHPVYPNIMLRTKIGDSPVTRNFLEANERSGAGCKSGDACCDAKTLQCGVFSADLLRERP